MIIFEIVLGCVRGWQPAHLGVIPAQVATLVVDSDRLHDADGRTLIAIGILEVVEACTSASEMFECLDGSYIYDDWDEEQFIPELWRILGDSDEG